jgi:hypothetical protein
LDLPLSDWNQGVSFPTGCSEGYGSGQCEIGGFSGAANGLPGATFEPYNIYTNPQSCDPLSVEALRTAVLSNLERITSSEIASLFVSSGGVNPEVVTDALDITPGTPSGFAATFQGIIQEMASQGIFEVWIHVPLGYETYLLRDGIIEWDADSGTYKMGPHTIVVDQYPNVGPGNVPPPVVDGSQVWVYGTGPMELGLTDPELIVNTTVAANTTLVRGERLSLLIFDPCSFVAAVAQAC